ncbi:hypothetical protein [Mesorhizobium sp. M1B.F.Ca.ET.045.04.1.1]|uniref:ATP-dependent DNA ligase n=1 Tax=unclassified Mesorhizobium TaxID=325217 RepID=UPI000F757A4A|nr:hypothetical protein EJ071_14570 [Mesorhizobium sp. M1B.F.Ca.ET.045.04.1.1]RWB20937.1 MAG: hypothetical protein EOQ40_13480 [Mesorhizobium sp.]RWE03192.1 MAG: hypothetical protein EOS40_04970 [Mesorhizobium sp.]TIS49215.1 MAG: hypothetical protein E5W96_15915 [Mesorhizobium sp.]TIT97553.1 MAG: hypothetical protein E5W55_08685 [Mesorhizobium sp.]
MEPVQIETPPGSDDWLHEIKYDGFRTQLILDWAGARAFTRTGIDWSKRYWPVIDAAEKLPSKSFIIDGEMMAAPDPDGTPNFHEMHSRMAAARGPLRRAQPADNQWKMRSNGAGKREQKDICA